MNLVSKTLTDAAIGVGLADDPKSLSVLKKPGCAAAIWRRQMPVDTRRWLDQLDREKLPRGRLILRAGIVGEAVQRLCDMAQTPVGRERDWLQSDIASMAALFADLMESEYLRLRLDAVSTNACRKFHIDTLTARLVCTYRGQGTQYGVSSDGGDPTRVFQVATGAPILIRGTLWPEGPPSGLLHRSPPIEGTGETRLVLVLDPVSGPEEMA